MDNITLTYTPPGEVSSLPFLRPSAPPLDDDFFDFSIPQEQKPAIQLYNFIEDYSSEDSRITLNELFTNPNQLYPNQPISCDLINSNNLQEDIKTLPYTHYAVTRAFQPYQTRLSTGSPIHIWLKSFSEKFCVTFKNLSPAEKIKCAEQFTAEFISVVIQEYKTSAPFQDQIFFPCLEIALRNHLFNKLIENEKSEISFIVATNNNQFPDNLAERENALEGFLTKNGFFINSHYYFYNDMVPTTILGSSIESCISKTNSFHISSATDSTETLIQTTLHDLNLVKPSRTSCLFEYQLRENLGKTLLSKYIQHYKEQFQKTGTISLDDFNNISTKIYNILSNRGNTPIQVHVKYEILTGIFELKNDFSFPDLRNQIQMERNARPASSGVSKLFSLFSRSSAIPADISQQKLATLVWAEQEWTNIFTPTQLDLPTYPEISEPVVSTPPAELNELEVKTSSSEDDWELVENPLPANPAPIKAQRPPQPLPSSLVSNDPIIEVVVPKKIEPIRINANSPNIPLVSYINIAFANCLKSGDDLTIWNSLPQIIRKDVLRHCYYLSNYNGKAEEAAARLFKTITEIQIQLITLENNPSVQSPKTNLSPAFIEKGEALLNIYYSSNSSQFFREFQSLPKEPLFYQYVYEMAKASGVHIESWDRRFAEFNWNKINMMNLSVQALERCLHTNS